ncbi:hypothetical protein BC936DRAFT_141036 [Jimgerdemannia flammicorona]|uniref:Uncharacterized protein n=1 Tax=Jimgerdemannia flammicorona TaxID=994334 RepID=A0A433A335_9FUNG|nr:hypothetical protein BC936DRAFT_141036 [Jimgerdemannia flammicorona]
MFANIGRARFTMGFLEYVAKAKIMPGENQKRVALKRLKEAHEHIIVKSSSPIGLQKHIGSLISDPQTPVSTPQRAGTQVVDKQIIDAPKFLQDILMASIFSRGQMLYNSADAIKFVRHGLCHLTRSETPWLDDVYESDEVEDDVTDIQEIVEELSIEDREALDTSNNIDEEDRQSNTSISSEPDVAVAARPEFWCTLAEPWVRYALIYFFSQRLATDAIYSEYLTGLMTSPTLTPAARGSLLEWTIMTKIKQNWTRKSLRGILKDSGLLPKHKILPRWLNDSLEVQPFDKILDESTVSAADDTLECFLSGVHGRVALLPTALAGPDGICATSTEGVFVVFASALSTKHDIEGKKCRKNIKTTDIENFYTKSDGRPYKLPESINSQFYSLRGRHDRIQSLQRKDGAIKGLLRIHFNIPKASGKIELCEVVEKGCRTDVIVNVDLKSAQDLHLLDGNIGNVLHALCKI